MPKASATTEVATKVPQVVIQTSTVEEKQEPRPERPKADFWTYMRSLSPQDWKRHVCYLYRTRPIVGQKQREKYLDVYSQAFTIDDVKARFGGEEFRAILLKDDKAVMTEEFSIEAAPKYDMAREIPGTEQSNAALVRDLVERVATQRPAESNPAAETAVAKSIDIMGSAFDAALKRVSGAAPSGDSGGGDLMKLVVVMIQGQQQLITTLLTSHLNKTNSSESAPANRITELKEIITAVKEISGDLAADAAPGNWKTRLVDKIADAAPQLISSVGGMLDKQASIERERTHRAQIVTQARAGGDHGVIAQAGVPGPQPLPPHVATNITPMRTVPLDRSNPNAPAASATEAGGEPSQEWISRRVYAAIEGGQSGEAVVDFLDCANPAITQYFARLTAEQIKGVFLKDSILQYAVTLPNFEEWLKEAVEYLHEEEPAPADAKPN